MKFDDQIPTKMLTYASLNLVRSFEKISFIQGCGRIWFYTVNLRLKSQFKKATKAK